MEENVPVTVWNWKTPPAHSVPTEQVPVLYLFEMQKWKQNLSPFLKKKWIYFVTILDVKFEFKTVIVAGPVKKLKTPPFVAALLLLNDELSMIRVRVEAAFAYKKDP